MRHGPENQPCGRSAQDQGRLAIKLGVEQVQADGAQNALGIEDIENAALTQLVGGLGAAHRFLRFLHQAALERFHFLAADLVAPDGAFEQSG